MHPCFPKTTQQRHARLGYGVGGAKPRRSRITSYCLFMSKNLYVFKVIYYILLYKIPYITFTFLRKS